MNTQKRTGIFQRIVLVILILTSISLLWNLISLATSRVSTEELSQEVQLLQTEVETLEQEVTKGESEFEQESIIRNELNMKKSDEIILQIPIPSHTPTPENPQVKDTTPIFRKWLQILF